MVYGVIACKDNGKVSGCSDGCVASGNSCKVIVTVLVLVKLGDEWRVERTPTHVLPR